MPLLPLRAAAAIWGECPSNAAHPWPAFTASRRTTCSPHQYSAPMFFPSARSVAFSTHGEQTADPPGRSGSPQMFLPGLLPGGDGHGFSPYLNRSVDTINVDDERQLGLAALCQVLVGGCPQHLSGNCVRCRRRHQEGGEGPQGSHQEQLQEDPEAALLHHLPPPQDAGRQTPATVP